MIRKIKALGLAAVAVLAMSAVVASAANASNFTASSYPAVGTGEQATNHVFTVQGQKVECTKAHFEGSLGAASETIEITPTYTGCTAFGIANADVLMNGCTYVFSAGTTKTTPNHFWEGSVYVKCPENATITVNAPKSSPLCVVHIPTQTPTSNKVDFENKAENNVLVTSTVSGIHSNVTDVGGFFCPLSNASTDTTGTYTGTVEFKGTGGKTASVS